MEIELQILKAKVLRYPISQLLPRPVFRFAIALPLSILFHSSNLERLRTHRNLKLKYFPQQINGQLRALHHFLFLILVEAPHRLIFHWILLKRILRKNIDLEHKCPQLQPWIIRKVALVITFNVVSQPLVTQDYSSVPALRCRPHYWPASHSILGPIRTLSYLVTSASLWSRWCWMKSPSNLGIDEHPSS